jgi:Flp pilus assembly protein TadG
MCGGGGTRRFSVAFSGLSWTPLSACREFSYRLSFRLRVAIDADSLRKIRRELHPSLKIPLSRPPYQSGMEKPAAILVGRLRQIWRHCSLGICAFIADRRGTVITFMAVAIIPLIGALGLATDAARGYMVRSQLSSALDAAALAGGKVMFSANRDADITMFFNANFPPGYMGSTVSGPVISVNDDKTKLKLTAKAVIATTFMHVLGFESMTVEAATEVTRSVDMLDLVISIDLSGSMGQPMSKIEGARDAAKDLVGILYGANTEAPTYTVDGTTYNLLNIGLVPWNAKTNVGISGETYDPSQTTTVTVPAFTNPVTGATGQTVLYKVNNSPVLFLRNPGAGWKGCVYARYVGDSSNTNDADLQIGDITVGGKYWPGYDPIPLLEGESRSGNWSSSDGEPWNSDYRGERRSCYGAYWNTSNSATDHPVAVPDRPGWWHAAAPTINNPDGNDCTDCLDYSITPLSHTRKTIDDAIDALQTPAGNTDIPQGLYWAWEVLMPGAPFDEAVETVPFPRQRAIVLLTDGEIVGGSGDAYGGRFGSGSGAGTTTNSAHGFMPSPPAAASTRNNLNNRLKQLAANVKAQGIKLYVIQFDNTSSTLTNLLKAVATEPNAPYYYNAPTVEELKAAFNEIASNLSKLRLSM